MCNIVKIQDFEPEKINFIQSIRDGQEINTVSYGPKLQAPWMQFSGTVQFDHQAQQPGNKVVFRVDPDTLAKFREMDIHFQENAPVSDDHRYNPIVYDHEDYPADVRMHLSKYVHDHSREQDDAPEQTMPSIVRGARVLVLARILRWYESPEHGVGYSIRIGRIRTISVDPEMASTPDFIE